MRKPRKTNKSYRPAKEAFVCQFCGGYFYARPSDVNRGHTKGCGCQSPLKGQKNPHVTTHGLSEHPLYQIAIGMLHRVSKNGLFVDPSLDTPEKLISLLETLEKDKYYTFVDAKKGITTGNISSSNKLPGQKGSKYLFRGEMLRISEIATKTGMSIQSINFRIKKGISLEKERRKWVRKD